METELTEGEWPAQVSPASLAGREGFTEAFDGLYECAYQHAYKLLGDREDAEDLAQEACARACLRWRGLENPRAWVTHVTTNLAFDRFRRRRAAPKYARGHRASAAQVDDPHLDLYRALAQLPKRQRDAVALRYLADFSEAQTASALGCSPGTVKTHAARGLRALRGSLDLAEGEEP